MDDPTTTPDRAAISRLRDKAKALLQDSTRCRDWEKSDRLLREALALLDQARAASGRSGSLGQAGDDEPSTPTEEVP